MLSHLISGIDLWWTKIDLPSEKISELEGYLDEAEIRQIKKQKFDWLRKRSVVSKGLLKLLISNYLNLDPAEIKFSYNKFGKPFITDNKSELQFNVSHSDEAAVFAFSRYSEIGVDIEKIKDFEDMEGVMNVCFTDYEKNWYKSISNDLRVETFYKVWTVKEAFIKAIGRGFSFDPRNVELIFESDQKITIARILSREFVQRRFEVMISEVLPGYVISLVYEGDREIMIHNWNEIS